MKKGSSITVNFTSEAANLPALAVAVAESTVTSPYSPADRVPLHLTGRGGAAVTVSALGCTVSRVATDQSVDRSEIVTLVKASSIQLKDIPRNSPQVKWLSHKGDYGRVSFVRPATVQLSKAVELAVVEINYVGSYDHYIATGFNGPMAVVLFEASDGRYCSIDLDIARPSAERKNVSLKIIDFSTEQPVQQAYAVITGPYGYSWRGYSDTTGYITLNALSSGEYTITVTADGFQSSNNDILANDRFTV